MMPKDQSVSSIHCNGVSVTNQFISYTDVKIAYIRYKYIIRLCTCTDSMQGFRLWVVSIQDMTVAVDSKCSEWGVLCDCYSVRGMRL